MENVKLLLPFFTEGTNNLILNTPLFESPSKKQRKKTFLFSLSFSISGQLLKYRAESEGDESG